MIRSCRIWLMTLNFGRHRSAALVKWAKETLKELELERWRTTGRKEEVSDARTDPLWMKVFLGIHIAAGASSFLLAPVALATAKGGKQHKRWGNGLSVVDGRGGGYGGADGVLSCRCGFWRWWRCSVSTLRFRRIECFG